MNFSAQKRLLDVVEEVLMLMGRPATSREIAAYIRSHNGVRFRLTGATPHKTVHARIATDILARRDKSRFYRFAPSTFALKSLIDVYPRAYRRIYVGFDRRRQLDHDPILHISTRTIPAALSSGFFSHLHFPIHVLKTFSLWWKDPKLPSDLQLIQVTSFILLTNEDHVLTFEPSDYFEKNSEISHAITIGLHGHFKENDLNLFDRTGVGFNFAIDREVHYFLRRFSGYAPNWASAPKFVGFVRDEYSPERSHSFGVVARVEIPRIAVDNHRLGYRNLNWRPLHTLPNDFVSFDTWSQYVFAGLDRHSH